jgi:hypothetical protein
MAVGSGSAEARFFLTAVLAGANATPAHPSEREITCFIHLHETTPISSVAPTMFLG